jgi:hypothetical protein
LGRWVVAAAGLGRCLGTCSGGWDPWSCWIRALRQDSGGPGESSVRVASSSTGCSPSRPWHWCWSDTATVVGLGVAGLLLAAPWWCLGMCQASLSGGVEDEGVVWSGFSGRKPTLSVAMVVAPLAGIRARGRGVRRWMRRGPHAEWPGSVVCIGAATRVFCRSGVGVE